MPTSLTLDTARSDDGRLVLIAAGEIDLSNIDTFNQALTTASRRDCSSSGETLTVDLSAVEYLDSAAINALVHPRRPHPADRPSLSDVCPQCQRLAGADHHRICTASRRT